MGRLTSGIARRAVLVGAAAAVVAGTAVAGVNYASAAEDPADLTLMVSTNANRSGAVELATNQRLSGRVAIFLRADTPVAEVRFHLDDPTEARAPRRVAATAPYDFHGPAPDGSANLLDVATLGAGKHTVTARVVRPTGGSRLINRTVTVTADATPSPDPSTPPAPPPTPAPSTSTPPPATGFPNERTTGVPSGTPLRASGGLTITVDNTRIDALAITGGVVIQARGVVITRSHIKAGGATYPVHVRSGDVRIEDTEIEGGKSAAVCCGNFTLTRVNLHHVFEGPRMNGNATVQNSYLHHLQRCSGCHIDALQSTGGSNIVIRGNNIQVYNPDLRDPFNAAFMFGEEQGVLRNCVVENNLMNGGNYTVNGGGGGTSGAQCTIRNNRFGRDFRYGPAANLGSGVRFEGNVWHDTGAPINR